MNRIWLTTLVAAAVLLLLSLQPVAVGESSEPAALSSSQLFEKLGTLLGPMLETLCTPCISICEMIPIIGPMFVDILESVC